MLKKLGIYSTLTGKTIDISGKDRLSIGVKSVDIKKKRYYEKDF